MEAPIEKLSSEELPPFPDDEQHAIYDLLARADASGVASARVGGVDVELEAA